jgi:hypothetical protein
LRLFWRNDSNMQAAAAKLSSGRDNGFPAGKPMLQKIQCILQRLEFQILANATRYRYSPVMSLAGGPFEGGEERFALLERQMIELSSHGGSRCESQCPEASQYTFDLGKNYARALCSGTDLSVSRSLQRLAECDAVRLMSKRACSLDNGECVIRRFAFDQFDDTAPAVSQARRQNLDDRITAKLQC